MNLMKIAACGLLILQASSGLAQNRNISWQALITQQNEDLGQISEGGLYRVKIEWQNPLVAGTLSNSAKVVFYDAYGAPKAVQLLSFKPYMVSMGHGSLRGSKLIMKQSPGDESLWNVDNVFFSMPGQAAEWAIDIEGASGEDKDRVRVLIPAAIVE